MRLHRDPADRRFRHYCETGDPVALSDVFDRTAGHLMRVALWLCGNRTDAEDLLQRTFLKTIQTRDQFRLGEPVLPWLMGLLGNEARRQRRERDRAATAPPVRDRVVDPEATAVAREFADAVRSVGHRLGQPYDEVLRLHLESGFNCKEIAARLERPAGTVRTQLTRALDLLRRRLPSGFAAGTTAAAVVGTGALGSVRAAVVAAAHGAACGAASTAASAIPGVTSPLRGTLMTKEILIAIPVLLLGSTVAAVALWPREVVSAVPTAAVVTANEPQALSTDGGAIQEPERALVGDPQQDIEAVALPKLALLGALPAGDPAVALTADGRRATSAAPDAATASVLLRIDRRAPWHEVTKLLDELRRHGTTQVQFAAQLPSGEVGCFTLALPANDRAGAAVELRLHRERAGVPPSSIVPILRRITRGREAFLAGHGEPGKEWIKQFPEPFTGAVTAPDDAPFEQVLQVMAAASEAGVQSLLVESLPGESKGPSDGDAANKTSASRGSFAIDLGPYPRIEVPPRAQSPVSGTVTSEVVGCTSAAIASAPERSPGGAGGRYGGRGNQRVGERAEFEWSPTDRIRAGFTWLAAGQQPDGSFLGDNGRPDLEATALVMLALLGKNTLLHAGEGSNVLNKGIGWILGQQQDDGCFARVQAGRQLRHHSLATHAVAEAFGLSFCLELRGLTDALAWLGEQQGEDGGFGNGLRGAPSDAASTAWTVMALVTAEFFGVETPTPGKAVVTWFDDAAKTDDSTALASELFCRFFVGQDPKQQKAMADAGGRLPETADPTDPWCSYWTSNCLYQMKSDKGEQWQTWRGRLAEIERLQLDAGEFAGSWQPAYGNSRVTTTALRVLALQTFYRFTRLIR